MEVDLLHVKEWYEINFCEMHALSHHPGVKVWTDLQESQGYLAKRHQLVYEFCNIIQPQLSCLLESFYMPGMVLSFLHPFFFFLMWTIFFNLLQYCFCFMFCFLWPQGMWDLNSLTSYWIHNPCIGRQSQPLDCQEVPSILHLWSH